MKLFNIYFLSVLLFIVSCNSNTDKNNKEEKSPAASQPVITKPQANFRDTIQIDFPAAVFYHPDSLQLEKIKELTEPRIFDASMHEYFYQMRNARISIRKEWPQLQIIEAKNARFLLFCGQGNDSAYIDLNTKNDPYGLFLFHPGKEPHFADMMNIDTELGFYFKK